MRSPEFYQALGQTVESLQAASNLQAVFDVLSDMLKAFDLEIVVMDVRPNQTITVEYLSIESTFLDIAQQITGITPATYKGRGQQITAFQEMLDAPHTLFISDVTAVFAEGLGFRGAKPIASRLRAALGVSEMIVAPLITSSRVTGLLAVMGSGNLTPDDMPYINILAAQLSVRWQALSVQDRAEAHADPLRLVAQISREAAVFPDLDPLLHRILRRLHDVIPGEYAFIALVEGEYIEIRIASYKSETYQPFSDKRWDRLRVGKEGIIGHVAADGQTLLVDDVRLEPRYVGDPTMSDVRSELAVSLRYREEIVGVLDVEANTLGAFDQRHVDLLEAVAGQLAAIIVTARLRAEIDDLAQEVTALTDIIEALSSTLPLEERLARIAQHAQQILGAEGVAIHLLDEDKPSGALAEIISFDVSDGSETLARLAEKVALGGQHEYLVDESSEGTWCLLSVPLRLENHSLGVITLVCYGNKPFREEDRRRLGTFASQAAIAVSYARLLEQNSRQRRLTETLNVVSRVVGSSLELNEVLEAILNALQEIILYTSASVMLFEGSKLTIAHARSMTDRELAVIQGVEWAKLPTVRIVITQRRPLVIPDTTQDETWHPIEGTERIKSWIGIPLISRGNIVGILNLNSNRPNHYQLADGAFLMAFANQIATALDNALLFRQTEERQLEARALYEATRVMVSSADIDEMIRKVLASIHQIIDYDISTLLRMGKQTSNEPYHIETHSPQPVDDDLIALAQQHIIEDYEVLSGNLVSRRGIQRDMQGGMTDAEEERLPSRLSVPLLLGDRLLGLIELNSATPDAYDESDLRILFTIANPLATALENASLVNALRVRAQDLEEADRLKDEVVQNISHELRNPLTFVRGYIQLLIDGELGPLNETQMSSLEVVSNKTGALVRLVNDIITLNSMITETLEREPTAIDALVEEAVKGVEVSAKAQKLSVKTELPGTPQMALVDSFRLTQVIDNLLVNAMKFSSEGGTIIARVLNRDGQVRIEVEDDGMGIPPSEQERIFDRYFQGDSARALKRQGVGLGLAISKQIVEAHGGIIGVESVSGEGSTFYIELEKHADD
jgi:signal transduction histidine kinase